jgi:hypothetical protein
MQCILKILLAIGSKFITAKSSHHVYAVGVSLQAGEAVSLWTNCL